jgi:hypothetical protein
VCGDVERRNGHESRNWHDLAKIEHKKERSEETGHPNRRLGSAVGRRHIHELGCRRWSSRRQQQIAHGEYLVKGLAGCPDCHTPMNEKGEFIDGKWLQGARLTFAPTVQVPNWADTSPAIAGLPGWDEQQAVKFFMTGVAPRWQAVAPSDAPIQDEQAGRRGRGRLFEVARSAAIEVGALSFVIPTCPS